MNKESNLKEAIRLVLEEPAFGKIVSDYFRTENGIKSEYRTFIKKLTMIYGDLSLQNSLMYKGILPILIGIIKSDSNEMGISSVVKRSSFNKNYQTRIINGCSLANIWDIRQFKILSENDINELSRVSKEKFYNFLIWNQKLRKKLLKIRNMNQK